MICDRRNFKVHNTGNSPPQILKDERVEVKRVDFSFFFRFRKIKRLDLRNQVIGKILLEKRIVHGNFMGGEVVAIFIGVRQADVFHGVTNCEVVRQLGKVGGISRGQVSCILEMIAVLAHTGLVAIELGLHEGGVVHSAEASGKFFTLLSGVVFGLFLSQ